MDKNEIANDNEGSVESRDTSDSNLHLIQFDDDKEILNISDKKRNIIFIILSIIATVSSLDGGIIPQQNEIIKSDFGGNNEERVGLFGSIDYIGRVVGSIIFTLIMGRVNRKMILVEKILFAINHPAETKTNKIHKTALNTALTVNKAVSK